MNLTERQNKIIRYLKQRKAPIKGSELAKYLNVTDRTVRADINCIKKILGDDFIQSKKGIGYMYIEQNQLNSYYYNLDFNNPNIRILFILKSLLISNSPKSIYELAEEAMVSERTIEMDINRLRKIISSLDFDKIYIKKENDSYSLIGYELISNNLLYEVTLFLDIHIDNMQYYFTNTNMDYLRSIVIKTLNEHKYESKYLSINRLLIDLLLIIESIYVYSTNYTKPFASMIQRNYLKIDQSFFDISLHLSSIILEKFGVKLEMTDINYISYILYINKRMSILENEIRNETMIQDDFYNTCTNILIKLKTEYGLNFIDSPTLTNNFIYHIRVAMKRIELGIKLYNPLTNTLIKEYPYVIDLAVMIADMLNDKYKIKFDFNEISYIGIYLATSLKDDYGKINKDNKLKVLLYIPEGISVLNLINQQLNNICDENKIIIDGMTNLSFLQNYNEIFNTYNLIITSSKNFNLIENEQKIFRISKSLNTYEMEQIKIRINKELQKMLNYNFQRINSTFLNENLFFYNIDLNSKEEIIDFLCNQLVQQKFVNNDFKKSIYAREKVVSTSFSSGAALPHSIKNIALKKVLAVAFLKNPVQWGDYKVHYVFMYANDKFSNDDSRLFTLSLVDAISDPSFIDILKSCKNFTDFFIALKNFFITNSLLNQ